MTEVDAANAMETESGNEGEQHVSPDGKSEKDKGNNAYANGDIEEALEHWGRSLRSCKYILSKNAYEGEEKKVVEDAFISVCLNSALGNIKLKKYSPALAFCEDVLQIDPKNIKGLYRKAQILSETEEYSECKESLGELLAINPDNAAAKKMLHDVTLEHGKLRQKEKKMMENVFQNLEADERVTAAKDRDKFSMSSFVSKAKTTLAAWLFRILLFMAALFNECCKRREKDHQAHDDYLSVNQRTENEESDKPQNRASRRMAMAKKKKK